MGRIIFLKIWGLTREMVETMERTTNDGSVLWPAYFSQKMSLAT